MFLVKSSNEWVCGSKHSLTGRLESTEPPTIPRTFWSTSNLKLWVLKRPKPPTDKQKD